MELNRMVSYPRAEIATVRIGHLELEGLMIANGTFGIGVPQIALLTKTSSNTASRDFKRLLGDDFKTSKVKTVYNKKYTNFVTLYIFELILARLDRSGNTEAQNIRDSLVGLSLHQLFSDAFYVKFEKEERQRWLEDRDNGKIYRRTLTDSIKDYLLAHPHADKMLYPVVTDLIYLGIFNRRAAELKVDWNETNPRDEMTRKELSYVAEVEALTSRLIDRDGLYPLTAAKEALTRLIIPVCDR
jgi:hypothetical protein